MAVSGAARRPPKAAMLVAQRIVQDALRKGLRAGDMLEPERTMLETYDTGRGTLREALRLLEFQGVILLKPGPRGGPILQDPDAAHLGSTLVLLMQLRSAPFRDIVEVRSAVEPMISRLAASRITDEELGELRAAVARMREEIEGQASFLHAHKRFHDIIAWSSGNALFGYVIESLLGIMDTTVVGSDVPRDRRSSVLQAHVEILEALESRDPEAAEARMREHIRADERYAAQTFPELMDASIPWDQRHFG